MCHQGSPVEAFFNVSAMICYVVPPARSTSGFAGFIFAIVIAKSAFATSTKLTGYKSGKWYLDGGGVEEQTVGFER